MSNGFVGSDNLCSNLHVVDNLVVGKTLTSNMLQTTHLIAHVQGVSSLVLSELQATLNNGPAPLPNMIMRSVDDLGTAEWVEIQDLPGLLSGSGTINTIPKWSGVSNLNDSNITDDGTLVSVISTSGLSVTQGISGATVTATGTVSGATVSSTGNVTATGTVSGATVSSTGNVTATGTVSGATVSSTGNVTATGTVSGATVSSTGTVTAGGAVYKDTTSTAPTSQLTLNLGPPPGDFKSADVASGSKNSSGRIDIVGEAASTGGGTIFVRLTMSTGFTSGIRSIVASPAATGPSLLDITKIDCIDIDGTSIEFRLLLPAQGTTTGSFYYMIEGY